jgi:hypothetical protein
MGFSAFLRKKGPNQTEGLLRRAGKVGKGRIGLHCLLGRHAGGQDREEGINAAVIAGCCALSETA